MSSNWADDESSEEGDIEHEIEIPVPKVEAPVQSQQPAKQRNQQNSRQQDRRHESYTAPYVIEVTNLNYKATRDEIGHFFANGGCHVLVVQPGPQEGTATVEFKDESSLVNSRGAHNTSFLGRDIRIRVVNNNRRGGDRGNRGDRQSPRGGRGDDRNRDQRGPKDGASSSAGKGKEEEKDWSRKSVPGNKARPTIDPVVTTTAPTAAAQRPTLNLTPRSIPVTSATNAPSSSSGIFGSGKAREEPAPVEGKASTSSDKTDKTDKTDKAIADSSASAASTDNTETTKAVKAPREQRDGQPKTVFKAATAATKQGANNDNRNKKATSGGQSKDKSKGGNPAGAPRQSGDYSKSDGKRPVKKNSASSKGKEGLDAEKVAAAAAKEATRVKKEQEKAKPASVSKSTNAFAALGMDEDE